MTAATIRQVIADQIGPAYSEDAGTFTEMGVHADEMLEIVDRVAEALGVEIPYTAFTARDMVGWTVDQFVEFAARFAQPEFVVPDEL